MSHGHRMEKHSECCQDCCFVLKLTGSCVIPASCAYPDSISKAGSNPYTGYRKTVAQDTMGNLGRFWRVPTLKLSPALGIPCPDCLHFQEYRGSSWKIWKRNPCQVTLVWGQQVCCPSGCPGAAGGKMGSLYGRCCGGTAATALVSWILFPRHLLWWVEALSSRVHRLAVCSG